MFCTNIFYNDSSCGICKEDYSHIEKNKCIKLVCGHLFHQICIEPWFENQQTCPTCRAEHIAPYSGLLNEISNVTYKRIFESRSIVIDSALLISLTALPFLIAIKNEIPKICEELAGVNCQTLGLGLFEICLLAEASLSTYYLIKNCFIKRAQIIEYLPIRLDIEL